MEKLYEIKEEKEKVILVGVCLGDERETEESLDELEDLVKTAGALSVGMLVQNREAIHPGTYIGKGKIEELKSLITQENATGIVCDDELSPAQLRNLEEELDCKIMDRTLVILEIFARHAVTREGKIQVELAQLKYRQSRLAGSRSFLSRLGAGIGTRGPGEKKLEMDRRLIKERIAQLRREITSMNQNRDVMRQQRRRSNSCVIAIVGYTNAGKSSLLNKVTDAKVLQEDKLFATLDTTTRALRLKSGETIMLTDTVGFIRKLPHHLIDAFRSTLEEAKYADMILHIVDCSNPQMDRQQDIVYETLTQLGIKDKPIITAFNKIDKLEEIPVLKDLKADETFQISVKTGDGLEQLFEKIESILRDAKIYIQELYDFTEAGKLQQIRKYGQLLKEEYTEEGIEVQAYVPKEIYQAVRHKLGH